MFLWAQLVFGVDLLGHFDGFVVMTIVTASAAAAFGLFLATLCKTRGQLNGLSVILVLSMSALGGSMVPRYLMSEQLREVRPVDLQCLGTRWLQQDLLARFAGVGTGASGSRLAAQRVCILARRSRVGRALGIGLILFRSEG